MSQLKTKYLGKVADGTFLAHNVLVREARVVPIADSDIIPPRSERGHEINIHNFSTTDEAQDLLEAFVENMKTILGKQTWKALGFAVATLFNDSIFSQFDFFPLLFLYGKHGTGKTAMAYWLQSLFGCHHQQHFNIGSTQKSYQRAGAKYKSCPVVLNEYQANERNNTTLCAIADQQGYSRAEKSNDLDILQGEINASFMVCSTQDIIGAKAEDAKSRCIEINTNDCHTDNEAFNWLQGHKDQFSCFIPIILANLNGKNLAIKIKQNLAQVRQQIKGKYEERILTSMTILAVCYEEFSGLLLGDQCDRVAFSEIANAVCDQTQETAKSDLGMTFLKIAVALASNNKIEPAIARFNPPLTQSSKDDKEPGPTATHEFLFSLTGILPFVRQQGKSSEIGISDEKTIAKSLEALGAEKKVGCRMLVGSSKTVWVIKSQLLALATD